jgi:hypothetical protein
VFQKMLARHGVYRPIQDLSGSLLSELRLCELILRLLWGDSFGNPRSVYLGSEIFEHFEGIMNRISIAGAALACLFATTAFAADLAPRTYTKAPPMIVDPGYNWTGFYAGIDGGYSWGRATETALIGARSPQPPQLP